MAYTAPRTWVVGEIVTAAIMNTHVRDNLKAMYNAAADSRFNPWPVASWQAIPVAACLGSNADVDQYYPASAMQNGAVNWDALNTVSATIQLRMSVVFNCSVIVPGAPSVLTWTGKLRIVMIRNNPTGSTVGSAIGSVYSMANSTGFKAGDTGWSTQSGTGIYGYVPVWRSDRTGGSGAGSIDSLRDLLEVKNV